jgi:hypothetical protein
MKKRDPKRYSDGTPRMRPQMCVECGLLFNASSPTFGKGMPLPKPGNVSLCLNCGHLSLFDDNLMLREPTADEAAEPEIIELQRRGKAAAKRPYDDPRVSPGVGMGGGRA